jgi:hypothetical protein
MSVTITCKQQQPFWEIVNEEEDAESKLDVCPSRTRSLLAGNWRFGSEQER